MIGKWSEFLELKMGGRPTDTTTVFNGDGILCPREAQVPFFPLPRFPGRRPNGES